MRRRIFAMFLLLGFLMPMNVMAANDQGLHWGVSVGQKFEYNWRQDYFVNASLQKTESGKIIAEVAGLPTIPDHLTAMDQLVFSVMTLKFGNGTDAMAYMTGVPMSMGNATNVTMLSAFPVGNWSLYDSYIPQNVTWVSNATHWGNSSYPFPGFGADIYFLKADGMLSYLRLQVGIIGSGIEMWLSRVFPATTTTTTTTPPTTSTTTTTTTTTAAPPIMMTLLVVGGGALVVIVLALVWMRSKK